MDEKRYKFWRKFYIQCVIVVWIIIMLYAYQVINSQKFINDCKNKSGKVVEYVDGEFGCVRNKKGEVINGLGKRTD